jgi:Mor family transcriptional regulator
MPYPRKEQRNKELVKKRKEGWTFRQLAQHYHIDVRAVWEIYQKYKDLPSDGGGHI